MSFYYRHLKKINLFCMVQNVQKNELFLLSVSLRSRGTIQGGSPGINRTGLRRQSRSQSLSSQRRSSSNSRKSTLAGSMRRIIKMHQGIKDRDCIHCGNAKSCSAEYTGVSGQDYTLQPSYEVFMCSIFTATHRNHNVQNVCHFCDAA